ncbi:hypothetical protein M0R45_013553 [Rubus argutus]|uniref:Uncharacterized protein n=1 Tax=Rubus argutus TaxID=59490 RepID=A0AAW1XIS8_RUBAR
MPPPRPATPLPSSPSTAATTNHSQPNYFGHPNSRRTTKTSHRPGRISAPESPSCRAPVHHLKPSIPHSPSCPPSAAPLPAPIRAAEAIAISHHYLAGSALPPATIPAPDPPPLGLPHPHLQNHNPAKLN